jgi:iron complex outermembrane recepter protein
MSHRSACTKNHGSSLPATVAGAVALLVAGWVPTTPALAQGGDASPTGGLEEIVVTARKREERLQDVPIAITAFDPEMLEQAQIRNVLDFNLALPSVAISATQGSQNSANIFIRGIGQDLSTILTESAVGVYVDGVYLARQIGGLIDLVDIERVEILRGPQGTLYGRNNLGGAVKLETRRPNTDALTYIAEATVGSFDRVDLRGAVNLPLSDNVALSLSALSRSNTGYYTNAVTGGELNRKDTQAVRAKLNWEISDTTNLLLAADYSRDRSGIQVGTPFTSTDPTIAQPIYGDLYSAAPGLEDLNRFSGWGVSATFDWDVGPGTLTSTTAFRRINYVQAYDLSGTPYVAPPNFPFPTLKLTREFAQNQISQELQYNSALDGPLNFTAGLYYFREEGDENLGFVLSETLSLPFIADQVSKSVAAYVEATYQFSDAFSATLGGRYTKDEKDLSRDGLFAGLGGDYSQNDFTPRAILTYKPSDVFMAYGSYSRGYQAGEFQPFPADLASATNATNPQEVEAYEVGAKTEWLDRRLRANVALFRSDYTNLAVGIVGNGNLVEQTSADVRVQGIELELSAQVSDGFNLSGYITKTNGEYVRAPGGANAPRVGEQPKNTPELAGRIAADYNWDVSSRLQGLLGGSLTYNDDYYALVPNIPWYLIESRTLVDARIGLRDKDNGWTLELAGKNLTDEEYALQTTLLSGPMRYYMPGRTWSLQFTMTNR